MKKNLFLVLPVILALGSCDKNDMKKLEKAMEDFDIKKYSKTAVTNVLEELQNSSGYQVKFSVQHYNDINNETPDYTADAEIGGVGDTTWAYLTADGETKGAAIKVTNKTMTYYWYEQETWELADEVKYKKQDIINYFDEQLEKLILDEEYVSKIDFTKTEDTEFVSSRECYKFVVNESNLEVKIDIDRYLGVAMYYSVMVMDYSDPGNLLITKDEVKVTSIGLNNIVAPTLPQ